MKSNIILIAIIILAGCSKTKNSSSEKKIISDNTKIFSKINEKIQFRMWSYILQEAYNEIDSIENSLLYRSASIMDGCYEGTQNQAKLNFRDDDTFDILWTGVFGGYDLIEGTFKRDYDTLVLNFSSKDTLLGNKFLVTKNNFTLFANRLDTTEAHYQFYKGECQGYN